MMVRRMGEVFGRGAFKGKLKSRLSKHKPLSLASWALFFMMGQRALVFSRSVAKGLFMADTASSASETRPTTSPSRSIVAAFWEYFEELHRWRGRYGRRALWIRPGIWLLVMVFVQFLLAMLSIWLLILAPLAMASILWVAACSIAKRLRQLRRPVWLGTLAWLVPFAVLAGFGRSGAGFWLAWLTGAAAPGTESGTEMGSAAALWSGMGVGVSVLALAAFALYIAFARGPRPPHQRSK